jgi:hypothetical protein
MAFSVFEKNQKGRLNAHRLDCLQIGPSSPTVAGEPEVVAEHAIPKFFGDASELEGRGWRTERF